MTPDETLELHTRAVNALEAVYATINGFEGVRAQEPAQRLDVDEHGEPTAPALPTTATRCACGKAVPLLAEFNRCTCGRVASAEPGDHDPVDQAMRADTSRAARKRIRRHLDGIASHVNALIGEEQQWTRPSGKRLEDLRKLAAEEELEAAATLNHADWCRICRKAGITEPRSMNPTYEREGLCSKCGKLVNVLARERVIDGHSHAIATVTRLVIDGNAWSPTTAQVIEAAGVTGDVIDANSAAKRTTHPLPPSARPKRKGDGQPWHSIDDYRYDEEAS